MAIALVGNEDVGSSFEEESAFHVSREPKRATAQKLVRIETELVSLGLPAV
jgi:hypothetical protein